MGLAAFHGCALGVCFGGEAPNLQLEGVHAHNFSRFGEIVDFGACLVADKTPEVLREPLQEYFSW